MPLGSAPLTAESWEPRIRFSNLTETKQWKMRSVSEPDGEVSFKLHFTGVFTEQFELQEFPFDTQCLTMLLTSSRYVSKLKLVPDPERACVIQADNFTQGNIYTLEDMLVSTTGETMASGSSSGHCKPWLKFSAIIHRRGQYFVWNIYLPLMCIVIMTLTCFTLERSAANDRLGLSLTMVLTAVAFKLQIGSSLPNLAYLTLVDRFALEAFVFIFFVVMENALMGICEPLFGASVTSCDSADFALSLGFISICTIIVMQVTRNMFYRLTQPHIHQNESQALALTKC
jgi:hypothetical protein